MQPYFRNSGFRLYLGDCIELLREFPDESIDMVFSDPPYFLSDGTFTCQNGKMVDVKKGDWDLGKSLEENVVFHEKWITECKRVLKNTGSLWVSGTYHSIYQCGYLLQKSGMHILNDIAWLKPNAAPNLSCRFFTASHETLVWAKKDRGSKHTFNYHQIKDGDWNRDFIKKPGKQMRSVWAISTPKKCEKQFGKHPTQKPEDLLRRIIIASSNPSDIILDPFCGSSTTGVVAHSLNRRYIGIDTSQEYLELSIKRYQDSRKIVGNYDSSPTIHKMGRGQAPAVTSHRQESAQGATAGLY